MALLQLAQGALHQVGEMVWIAEALHCDTAVANALQEGVLPLAVLPIHQGLRWQRQLPRAAIEQKDQPRYAKFAGGYEFQLGVGKLRLIPHR